jgi:hypothetical protein
MELFIHTADKLTNSKYNQKDSYYTRDHGKRIQGEGVELNEIKHEIVKDVNNAQKSLNYKNDELRSVSEACILETSPLDSELEIQKGELRIIFFRAHLL